MRRSWFLAIVGSACAAPSLVRADEDRLAAIETRGALLVGLTGDYKPYSYLAPNGSWSGLDVDVARALAEALGVQTVFVKTSWTTMSADLSAGAFDIAMGGVSRDPTRAAVGLLSAPYVRDGKVALIRVSDREKFHGLADLDVAAVRVAVNPGGTNESFVRAHFTHAQILVVDKNLAIPPMIAGGGADVMITDGVEAALAVRSDPRLTVLDAAHPYTSLEKVYFLPKDASSLLAFVDDRMRTWNGDGTYARWRTTWIGSDLNAPPRGQAAAH
jgi:cyclohexadienyl dehydratase